MSSVSVITDSNSGISQEQAKELGIRILPMPFYIDGKEYTDGITLSQDTFYEMLNKGYEVATSQPSAGDLIEAWEDELKTHDEVIYIPMSSGLSSSLQTAKTFCADYDGRVQVADNQRISVTQRFSAIEAKKMADKGKSAAEIKEFLESTRFDSSIYIMVDTMTYLKKGGRVTPAAATFAEILNIKPVLQIQGDKLDSFAKARGCKAAKKIMINAIKDDIEKRFGGIDPDNPKVEIEVAHTMNHEAAVALLEELKEIFPNHPTNLDPLSLSVACHIGPGALAIATSVIHDI